MYTKCACPGCDMPNISGGPICDNCKDCCKHHYGAEPMCPKCYEALEDQLFRMKQIGDRLFMHANKIAIKDRTPELDEAIMAWGGVHKGEY